MMSLQRLRRDFRYRARSRLSRLGGRGDDEPREPLRIARRLHLRVVVEIAVDVARAARWRRGRDDATRVGGLATFAPAKYALGPSCEGRWRVAAHVELLVAVQAHIHEIGGNVLDERPFASGVGDDERDPMLAQQCYECRIDEAWMTDLDRVAQRAIDAVREARAASHFLVAAARERGRLVGVTRQQFEEALESIGVEAEHRRQLPQERTELVALGQIVGIEPAAPRLVAPAGDADTHDAFAGHGEPVFARRKSLTARTNSGREAASSCAAPSINSTRSCGITCWRARKLATYGSSLPTMPSVGTSNAVNCVLATIWSRLERRMAASARGSLPARYFAESSRISASDAVGAAEPSRASCARMTPHSISAASVSTRRSSSAHQSRRPHAPPRTAVRKRSGCSVRSCTTICAPSE